MIFHCRIIFIICCFFFLLMNCCPCIFVPEEKENKDAPLIRKILRANGVKIADNESVEKYLYYSPYIARYYIVLPQGNSRTIRLTDDITALTMVNYSAHKSYNLLVGFAGITSLSSERYDVYVPDIDSLIIETDSVVIIPRLELTFKNWMYIDPSIAKLMAWYVMFSERSDSLLHNAYKMLPFEIMGMSTLPYYYDSLIVHILNMGNIDSISEPLRSWLLKYGGNGAPLP